MDIEKLKNIKKSFTEEQATLYNTLLGDTEKLKREWFLCRRMYDSAMKIINAKETGYEVRLLLRPASSDYWNRRRLALERTMEMVGMNDLLVAWRKEYKESNNG